VSYEDRTIADLRAALAALAQIGSHFSHLPAADFTTSTIFPDRAALHLHDDLGDFELWREALDIPTSAVEYRTLPGNTVLKATTEWGGATIEVNGYGPLPAGDNKAADGGEQQ
jgi:hypothetical protein